MRKIYLLILVALVSFAETKAQISFNAGHHNFEISGAIYGFYNHRFDANSRLNSFSPDPLPNNADYNNNRFDLRNAVITFEGRSGRNFEYQVQYNFAKTSDNDPENPALMDAYMAYKGFKYVKIKAGYQKLPYSRMSQTSFSYMPFVQRAEIIRGEVFSRRDIGIVLYQDYWNQRVNAYLGAFSGNGESALTGRNDINGKLEYVGRVDVSYPVRLRYREIDVNHSPVPIFQVGVNARYKQRADPRLNDGNDAPFNPNLPPFPTVPRYELKNIQGTKRMVGFDLAAQYQGLAFQFEWHQMRVHPGATYLSFLNGKEAQTNFFKAGGFVGQLTYHAKPLKSAFAVRYDRLLANDLAGSRPTDDYFGGIDALDFGKDAANISTQENVSLGYMYFMNGFNSVLRIDYRWRWRKDLVNNRNAADQIRIGWQYLFN
jgi:hypothetical protein